MSAIITEEIPRQAFEHITERIGAILLLEITNQFSIKSIDIPFEIYLDRIEPIDKSEDIVINVSLGSVTYDNQNEFSSAGSNNFYIDVYCNAQETSTKTASTDARLKLHQISGIIRYILSSTKYKCLGYDFGLISGTYVQSINFDDNFPKEDGSMFRMARINFLVRADEFTNPDDYVDFLGNDTTIKLSDTNKGFKLTFNI